VKFTESPDTASGRCDIRIVAPAEETPLAGHPTLGTVFVVREYLGEDQPKEITLNPGGDEIPVWGEDADDGELSWMQQIQLASTTNFHSVFLQIFLDL
jgi:trans-2,3-dihydro-3-hydroxyanthranilate isomerase